MHPALVLLIYGDILTMTDSLLFFNNIAIPVVGMFILAALAVAVKFEAQKDFSRKVYSAMLYFCAVTLVAEGVQSFLSLHPAEGQYTAVWITMFVFYLMLAGLCFCWTIYSYYWFSGYPPSSVTGTFLALGMCIEAAALIINFFNGMIFSVGENGVYERGDYFTYYIGFCYAFLITAILITAIRASVKNSGAGKRDSGMFLLCFMFPILGPLLQYFFPDFSLMGITEAVALLIVYVSIQQRSTAQYAVEKARYLDEYREYEESVEQLLAKSSNALRVFRLNLTKNTFSKERGGAIRNAADNRTDQTEHILSTDISSDMKKYDSVDEMFIYLGSVIRDRDEALCFRKMFERQSLLKAFADQQRQMSLEYHRRVDNGEMHLIRVMLNMLKNPGNGDVEAIVYSVDIDRQEKEEKVISAVTNREYDFIALIDSETQKLHYQYTSQKSDRALRFEMGNYDDMIKKAVSRMRDLSKPGTEFEKISFVSVADALYRRHEYSYVFEYTADSGEKRQKKITYQYLDDNMTEILFFCTDITEEILRERNRAIVLQKALQDAKHADIMKTEFLSNVSHDMRTPLNAVLGYTSLAKKSDGTQDKDIYLDKIEHAGNILLSLINDTLDLSKIEAGSILLKPVTTSYDELIKRVVSVISPLAEKKHIKFSIESRHSANVPISADPLRMQEIIVNLLSNAVKFTPENGEVFLITECLKMDKKKVYDRITVRDTGCGMTPDFIPKMYEPFSQERQTADTAGSGLGLPIVKKLVDLMNGRIEVKSEVGKGTEFTIWLSFERTSEVSQEIKAVSYQEDVLKGLRILMAEDNEMNTEITKSFLEGMGISVTCAVNGQIACSLFSDSKPNFYDAILMDIRMPVMNGRDAAKAIRRMKRPDADIPIIAMSADAFDEDIRMSLDAGMNAHIAKPVTSQQICEALGKLVRDKIPAV